MKKVLVVLHLYYHKQAEYFARLLQNITGVEWELFVTMSEKNEAAFETLRAVKSDVKFVFVENKGYDVLPFLEVLKRVELANFDFVLKLQTKNTKSLTGEVWRDMAAKGLLGSRELFGELLRTLDGDDETVMAGAAELVYDFIPPKNISKRYFSLKNELLKILKIKNSPTNTHFSGTMFLAKSETFTPFVENLDELLAFCYADKSVAETGAEFSIFHMIEVSFGFCLEGKKGVLSFAKDVARSEFEVRTVDSREMKNFLVYALDAEKFVVSERVNGRVNEKLAYALRYKNYLNESVALACEDVAKFYKKVEKYRKKMQNANLFKAWYCRAKMWWNYKKIEKRAMKISV